MGKRIGMMLLGMMLVFGMDVRGGQKVEGGYAIVVSKATAGDGAWKEVVGALKDKYEGAVVIEYEKNVGEALGGLKKAFPKYTCFVAKPSEAGRAFVADVHRMTRKLDGDPYTDTIWGVLTGFDAANALRIAKAKKPLVIKKVASGTELAMDRVVEGKWYCELVKNKMVTKDKGGKAVVGKCPTDTTKLLAETLTKYGADLFVTSGHATERNWQIGFRYRNGYFVSKGGQLFGRNTKGELFSIKSDNPKVYLPIGNCLMGHIDGKDAMALAWLNSAGVNQMIGYTVVTWYGYGGWGCLDYFVEQPGRYTFAEAFWVNHQALLHRMEKYFPEAARLNPAPGTMRGVKVVCGANALAAKLRVMDGRGLLFDRDVVAFYGDPAWRATMAKGKVSYGQKLVEKDGVYTLTISPRVGEDSFKPVNMNGSQRGWRPIVEVLPHRVKEIEILKGKELGAVVADDFVLVPNPKVVKEGKKYEVVFRAKRVK